MDALMKDWSILLRRNLVNFVSVLCISC